MFINENAAFSINDLMPLIEESIKSGQKVKMQVSGISMTPLLHDVRDAVVLEKPDKLKKYDIVLHRRENGQYILHRIIKKKGDVLTIAGDFETEKEYPVYENQVIAKVTSFRRNGKEYSVTDFIIRLYSRLWLFIFPQRQNVLYLINVIRRKLHV
jgi:signal peptidase I